MVSRLSPLFRLRHLAADRSGAVLIEAAFALSLLLVMLVGIVTYGLWLMTANSLQQVANEAARSALGAMSAAERQELVDRSIAGSLLQSGAIAADRVTVSTRHDGGFFTVTLSYDTAGDGLFATTLVPLPSDTIVRSAGIAVGGG